MTFARAVKNFSTGTEAYSILICCVYLLTPVAYERNVEPNDPPRTHAHTQRTRRKGQYIQLVKSRSNSQRYVWVFIYERGYCTQPRIDPPSVCSGGRAEDAKVDIKEPGLYTRSARRTTLITHNNDKQTTHSCTLPGSTGTVVDSPPAPCCDCLQSSKLNQNSRHRPVAYQIASSLAFHVVGSPFNPRGHRLFSFHTNTHSWQQTPKYEPMAMRRRCHAISAVLSCLHEGQSCHVEEVIQ